MSGIWMICQVMWLYHLNTGHPYCPVFRWIRCSVFRWLLYTLLLCWVKKSSKKVLPIILYLTELWHVCFSDPTCRSKVPEAWFNVRQTYSLSSLAFKRATQECTSKWSDAPWRWHITYCVWYLILVNCFLFKIIFVMFNNLRINYIKT